MSAPADSQPAPAAAAAKKEKKEKAPAKGAAGPGLKLADIPKPAFWADRIAIFDKLYQQQCEEFQKKKHPIKVTLPDGKSLDGESWITTPLDIAKKLSNSLPDKVFLAKVNDSYWDLTRPFEGDSTLELLDWDDVEARRTFWHSSAHVLGYALERVYGAKLSVGPPLPEGGFYYEGEPAGGKPVVEGDYPAIESAMQELVKAKVPYQRLTLSKEDALKLFGYNEFKHLILAQKVPEHGKCTVYRCGDLIDPCKGPHLPDTGRVKALKVTKNSSSYFLGDAKNASLQRVYAITFPKDSMLKDWELMMIEAAKRDHRTIGRQQDLFYFHDVSPGSAFFFPPGARIYNTLVEFQRKQYRKRGFTEVISPNIYNAKLWMVSGHWAKYKDNMFTMTCEHEEYGLKPMNCPGHCMMFRAQPRSYKDLPIRYADFGVLHRNEISGALTGLTRVRRFQQDDAHIFCRLDQVGVEIKQALEFLRDVYEVFGFTFQLKLSTKPENALGHAHLWSVAEARLAEELNAFCGIPHRIPDPLDPNNESEFVFDGKPDSVKKMKKIIALSEKRDDVKSAFPGGAVPTRLWTENPGDGAFYGPKIDIAVEDALKRTHQLATIQLDFVLPERFGLKYTMGSAAANAAAEKAEAVHEAQSAEQHHRTAQEPAPAPAAHAAAAPEQPAPASAAAPAGHKELALHIDQTLDPNQARPVMIHRAIFGSLERCIAILCEHFGGKWPFWLSPRQAIVIPVSQNYEEYAKTVRNELYAEGFEVELDDSSNTLNKKILNAEIAQYNFILVVGAEEVDSKTVNVRTRDNQRHGAKKVDELAEWFHKLSRTFDKNF